MHYGNTDRRRGRAGQDGIAMVLALFALGTLLTLAASALLLGGADVRATRNYRGASQVHFAAESGVSQALQNINAVGVIHFQNDIVNRWGDYFGNASRNFAPLATFTYTVSAVPNAANPGDGGRLIATANGVEGVRNVVVANVTRSNLPSTAPGAIYLANDGSTNADFTGNAFDVDGNDHNYTGGAGPASAVPGISTRNDSNTQEAVGSLSSGQRDNVRGYGYSVGPPVVPSVNTSPAAPTIAQMDQMIADFLAKPGVVVDGSSQITGNVVFGTAAAPQITYMSSETGTTIKGNGNASGAGIMIVDGDLTIQGSFEFKGLILVRGRTNVHNDPGTGVTGNATVYGTLWTQDLKLNVGGSAIVYYSSQALALANTVGGGGALPAPLVVTSLVDCAQLPAATGGCP